MVTEVDFERRLPSQCHLPMTTCCKLYSSEHAEALHRAQTAQVPFEVGKYNHCSEAYMLDIDE